MAEGQKSNILQAIEYRKGDLFSEIKRRKPINLRQQFQEVICIPTSNNFTCLPFSMQTHTHPLTFTLTHRLLPILDSLADPSTIFPPKSFQSEKRQKHYVEEKA